MTKKLRKQVFEKIKCVVCNVIVKEERFRGESIYTGTLTDETAKAYSLIAAKYADQECINFLKHVNSIPIDIRSKYTVERLYQAYINNEKLC